jgi:long-chain fatty acid transport protein
MLKKHLALSLFLATYAFELHAGGIILYEIGSDDVGLAAAGYSARAQDPSTMLTNPAGLTRLPGKQVFLGTQLLYENIHFDTASASPFLGADNGGDPVPILPGGSFFYHHSVSDDCKLGLGMYGNFGAILRYDNDWVGRFYTLKDTLLATSLQPTFAYRFNREVSIGAGPVISYNLFRKKTAINNTFFQGITFPDGDIKLSDAAWGTGVNIGLLYEFNPCSRIGVSYTSEQNLNFNSRTQWSGLSPNLTVLLAEHSLLNSEVEIGIHVPQTIMVSLFHQTNPKLALLSSFGWQNWSRFGEVEIGIESANPVSITVDEHYHDTWHAAVGIQYRLCSILWNAGIGYDSGFQNANHVPPSAPVNSAWRFGTGAHFCVGKCTDLGLNLEFVRGDALSLHKEGSIAGDLTGDFKHPWIIFLAANLNWKRA